MKKHPKTSLIVNTLGAMGYMTCLLLWGWTGIVYLPMILANEHVERFLLPPPQEPATPPPAATETSPVVIFLALAATLIVMIVTAIVLLRAPVTIAKTGKTVTTKAATSALPLITRGQPLPAAKKRRLTAGLVKLTKLLLALLPVAIGFLGAFIELPLPLELVLFVSSILAFAAVGWFSAQYVLARLLGINVEQLV